MIDTAEDMCKELVRLMSQHGMKTDIVNDVHTNDSIVEHVLDVDVIVQGYIYNVHINVNRFSKV